jgi:endonuclease/exonuclease/phosphatase family metal-dependent hydrolase
MKRILIILNYVSIVLLLLSYISPFIDPRIFWPIALCGLVFPFLLIGNGLFLLYWIVKRKKHKWVSLVVILLGMPYAVRYLQINSGSDPAQSGERNSVDVLSFNVRLFDLYNWKNAENEVTRDNIYKFLADEDADIMCFQEYYSNDRGDFTGVSHIVEIQRSGYHHIKYSNSIGRSHWGIATFSKYPIVNKGSVSFSHKTNNICIFSDIVVGKDTVRIYNAHLGSVHFGYEEYDFLQAVAQKEGSRDSSGPLGKSQQIEKARREDIPFTDVMASMVRLLRDAYINRAEQASAVAEHASSSPYPVVICGDINDTPVSYAYQQLADQRQDAFMEAGNGFGNSYAGVVPLFRIDYILCDEQIRLLDFNTRRDIDYSDHYPLSCTLGL